MSEIYTTKQGDTWDVIAKEVYNDEGQIGILLKENLQYVDTWIFSAGCKIVVPDIEDSGSDDEDMPDWREDDTDEEEDEEYVEEDDDE